MTGDLTKRHPEYQCGVIVSHGSGGQISHRCRSEANDEVWTVPLVDGRERGEWRGRRDSNSRPPA